MLAILGPCAAVALAQMTPPVTPLSPERIRALVKKLEEPTRHQTDQKPGPPDGPWPTFRYRWHMEEIWELQRAGEAAVPALLALLGDKSKPGQARAHAVAVMVDRIVGTKAKPDSKVVAEIKAALADKDPALRWGVLTWLMGHGLAHHRESTAMWKNSADPIVRKWPPAEELSLTPAVMDAVLPGVISAIADDHPEIVTRAAQTIDWFGQPRHGVSELLAALRWKEPEVRAHVASALGRVGKDDPEALKAVLGELDPNKYGNPYVYIYVVQAVGRFGPQAKEAVPVLIELLKDDRWREKASGIYTSAITSLGNIGPDARAAAPAILARMFDPVISAGSRAEAIVVLDMIDPAAARQARAEETRQREEFRRWTDAIKMAQQTTFPASPPVAPPPRP